MLIVNDTRLFTLGGLFGIMEEEEEDIDIIKGTLTLGGVSKINSVDFFIITFTIFWQIFGHPAQS